MPKKLKFETLKKRYAHLEWHHCLETDLWIVQAVNMYGKWGHVMFPHSLTTIDTPSVEVWLMALEDFRKLGKSLTRTILPGRWVELPRTSEKRKK